FLFFYLRSIYGKQQHLKRDWRWNLIFLVPIILFVNLKYPFEYNIDLWRPYIIYGIYAVWFVYTICCLPYIVRLIKSFNNQERRTNAHSVWDLSLFIGNTLIWAAFSFCGYMSYILGALLFSFLLYLLVLLIIFRNREDFSVSKQKEKYKNRKIEEATATQLVHNLEFYMESTKVFTDPKLKMADVAKAMNILPHTLSQVLNDNLGKSFPQFLNEMRIDLAKVMIQEKPNLTFEAIGYDCGFNSKSTFYSSFKKITGKTPSAYLKEQNEAK
ncbi:MAG: helix-turn-helix domain-containing protein, partial [Bacteroidota bacterium]